MLNSIWHILFIVNIFSYELLFFQNKSYSCMYLSFTIIWKIVSRPNSLQTKSETTVPYTKTKLFLLLKIQKMLQLCLCSHDNSVIFDSNTETYLVYELILRTYFKTVPQTVSMIYLGPRMLVFGFKLYLDQIQILW